MWRKEHGLSDMGLTLTMSDFESRVPSIRQPVASIVPITVWSRWSSIPGGGELSEWKSELFFVAGRQAHENASACAVSDAFENPPLAWEPQSPVNEVHRSETEGGNSRLTILSAPCEELIGSAKVTSDHEHRRGTPSLARCGLSGKPPNVFWSP